MLRESNIVSNTKSFYDKRSVIKASFTKYIKESYSNEIMNLFFTYFK